MRRGVYAEQVPRPDRRPALLQGWEFQDQPELRHVARQGRQGRRSVDVQGVPRHVCRSGKSEGHGRDLGRCRLRVHPRVSGQQVHPPEGGVEVGGSPARSRLTDGSEQDAHILPPCRRLFCV